MKSFKNREELKKDIIKWRRINIGCIVIGLLCIIAGVIGEAFEIDVTLATTSYLLLAIFFAVLSIAPHIQVAIDKHLYGIESEHKK